MRLKLENWHHELRDHLSLTKTLNSSVVTKDDAGKIDDAVSILVNIDDNTVYRWDEIKDRALINEWDPVVLR